MVRIKSQGDSIKSQNDSIQKHTSDLISAYKQLNTKKNDLLYKKSEAIINAQNVALHFSNELHNQLTGGNSIPLLMFDTTRSPNEDEVIAGLDFGPLRLKIRMKNFGNYPLNYINITCQRSRKHAEAADELPLHSLATKEERIIGIIPVEQLADQQYNASYLYTVLGGMPKVMA